MAKLFGGLSFRKWMAAGATALLIVGGCAPDTVTFAAAAPAPLSEQVLAIGFSRIAEIYLQPVDMSRLSVDGLSGLRTLDPQLKIERTGQTIQISRGSRPVTEFAIPEDADPAGWATLTTHAVERTRQFSPILHDASPDQLYQVIFDSLMPDLDAYSRYTGPQRANTERAIREGYGGIGLALEPVRSRYTVSELTAHSPADRAGLTIGDVIDAIDGTSLSGLAVGDVREMLRGTPGSVVQLTLTSTTRAARRIAIHRERMIPNAVHLRIDGTIAILKIERFNAATTTNLRDAIVQAQAALGHRATGYILDLRGNPGGLLDQAVAVSELFIRRGRIVSTAGRHPDSWQRFDAAGEDLLHEKPLVVLIDGRSASASEIVAAALQDSGRAVVVGASSYGKGSVQTVTRLPNDGELFLTWSRIYAPSGYTLHRQGVQPTICTSHDVANTDTVLAPLRSGQMETPSALAHWRSLAPDDEAALAHLRQACPWKAHEPELDINVAERLLTVPMLYRSALALSNTAVAER